MTTKGNPCSPRFSQTHSPKQRIDQDHIALDSLCYRIAGYLRLLIEFQLILVYKMPPYLSSVFFFFRRFAQKYGLDF